MGSEGKGIHHLVKMVEAVLWLWASMAADGTGSLAFIVDVSADRSSRMSLKVFRALLSAQIQPKAAKQIFGVDSVKNPSQSCK